MNNNFLGTMITIFCLTVAMIVLPAYYIGIIQYRDDYAKAENIVSTFIDQVIDTKTITKDMKEDLELNVAAMNQSFSIQIVREIPVINPNRTRPDDFVVNYTKSDKIYDRWRQGDIITVKLISDHPSFLMSYANRLLKVPIDNRDIILSGRVR